MAVTANGAARIPAGATQGVATSAGAFTPHGAFAAPLERGGGHVPPRHRRREPVFHILRALGMLTRQRPADHDALDGLGQVQPGAPQRGVERHHAMGAQPADHRLVGSGLILAEQGEPEPLAAGVGAFDQLFMGVVSGSVTSTGPALRLRTTVPVWHQVRLSCQEYPASHSVCKIVPVLTCGRPSGAPHNARCNVVSDQVAVPSRSRSGARRNSRRIRSRSGSPYWVAGPPPCRRSSAASPTL